MLCMIYAYTILDKMCVQVIPVEYLRIFNPDQFSLLLSGVPTIDVDDWEQNTEVHMYVLHINNVFCILYNIVYF